MRADGRATICSKDNENMNHRHNGLFVDDNNWVI